ncbi:FHA domain-containing protein [Vulgatibacter sp.]|uniref:FHA domain-containing protein n=1 Tax=Vulgatibacter sp. TaxID=1971226 RepID=UPI003568E99F
MIHCNACGRENAASFNYCLDCGGELRPAAPTIHAPAAPIPVGATPGPGNAFLPERKCPACATAAPASFAFCGSCGVRLDAETPTRSGTMFMHAVPLAKSRARLVSIQPDGTEGEGFPIDETEVVVGSGPGAIRFAEDPYVSPRHCRFSWVRNQLQVEDLGAANGVFRKVRGELVLQAGDHLRLGRQLLRLEPMAGAARARADGTKIWGSPDPGYQARLLQLLQGGGIGEVFPLKGGDNLLGREQGDVTFPTDRFVSGRHAVVTVGVDGFRLRDLGSSNGTFVRLTRPAPLEAGDFLLVGNQLLRVDLR